MNAPSDTVDIKTHVLPNSLARLTEIDIMKLFLNMEKDNGGKTWENDSFVKIGFFKKIAGGFINGFLKSPGSVNINDYPLEALIWAYSKEEENQVEARVIGILYEKSRKGQIIPRNRINAGNITAVDSIIDYYFSLLKKNETHQYKKENAMKSLILTLIESRTGEVNNEVFKFLADIYADYSGDCSLIINSIGRATYGLEASLESSVRLYLKQIFISFTYKKEGAQYGVIAIIQGEKKFFVKSHKNYPYSGFGQVLHINSSSNTYSDSVSARTGTIKSVSSVDLKELFVYKILEFTEFGPKTHFILNENLQSGLYIGTDELNNFTTIKSIEKKKEQHNSKYYKEVFNNLSCIPNKKDYVVTDDGYNSILINLTAFDIIARSLLLFDLNQGNIGFSSDDTVKVVDFKVPSIDMISKMNYEFSRTREFCTYNSQEFKDFADKNQYFYYGILDSFLRADSLTQYPDFFLGAFKPTLSLGGEIPELFEKQKRSFGLFAKRKIGSFEHLLSIFEKAYNEICNLAQSNEHVFALRKGVNTGVKDQDGNEIIAHPLKDLEQYKDVAIIHLKLLYTFLSSNK